MVAVLAAAWLRLADAVSRAFFDREDALWLTVVAALAIGVLFSPRLLRPAADDNSAALYGGDAGTKHPIRYAGLLNFAGTSFFGIGAYTAAVLNTYTAVPHLCTGRCHRGHHTFPRRNREFN
jgi:hypothetical protein